MYAKNIELLARFYEKLLSMTRLHATVELTILASPDFQLVLHAMPPNIDPGVIIDNPPERRQCAIRLFFTVPSIHAARSAAEGLGGEVFLEQWHGAGFRVCNASDPEGNIFQVRENVP